MKSSAFDRDLSAEQLARMFETLFIETMEGIAGHLELAPDKVREHFPSNVDVQVRIVNASDFMTDGRTSNDITALKKWLSQRREACDVSIFDEINEMHAAQGGTEKLIRKSKQIKIATALLEDGSWYTATASDTIFVLLIRPDHLPSADHHMAALAGLKKKEVSPSMLGTEALQNMHLLRHLGDNAHAIAMDWLAEVMGPKLIEELPEGDARQAMREKIDILNSSENFGVNKMQRFEEMIAALRKYEGNEGAQQYQDALMFHALAHGGQMDMLLGKLVDIPQKGLMRLRQAFAVHQCGLENTDPAVVKVAEFLSIQDDGAVDEAIKLFGKPKDELLKMGFTQDMTEFLHHTKRKFAKSDDVRAYARVLRGADKPDVLADVEKVVPFIFHYIETQALRMDPHTKLRIAVQQVANGNADDATHAKIDALEKDMNLRDIFDVYGFVLAQRYLDAVKGLMPERFPALAPSRGLDTDARMAAIKNFFAADWSKLSKN